jgi:tRNA(Ile)-lysidine synthase
VATNKSTSIILDALECYLLNHVVVAYSGGMDSHVLLHALATYFPWVVLEAVHVNHQQSLHANVWERHTESICAELGVCYHSHRIDPLIQSGDSLEAVLRKARFAVLETYVREENSALFLAHHADDQAETVLLRLLRGAGPTGLGAMQSINGFLRRPFLTVTRAQLQEYAHDHALKWIEDESNTQERFDRNYLRHRVMPWLKSRWPGLTQSIGRTADLCQENEVLLREIAIGDGVSATHQLDWRPLRALSTMRQANAIRHWLHAQGVLPPSQAQLNDLLNQLKQASPDKVPTLFLSDHALRFYRNELYCTPKIISASKNQLVIRETQGEGLAQHKVSQPFTVATRSGGETIKLGSAHCHQTLKNCWQKWGVPPWLRDHYPLLYQNGQLIAVPNYAYDADFEAKPGEVSWVVEWAIPDYDGLVKERS